MSQISVLGPVSAAIAIARKILFEPFDFTKWLGLGFTAWLALLNEGGIPQFNFLDKDWQNIPGLSQFWNWIQANLMLVITIGSGLFVCGLIAGLLITWLSCRGKFMFLDNVTHNRAEIKSGWNMSRKPGNSLFLFSVVLGAAALVAFMTLAGLTLLLAWPDIARQAFGAKMIAAIIFGALFLICYFLVMGCLLVFLGDFVTPIMAMRNCDVMPAWSEFLDLFRAHVGSFALYLLFRLVLLTAFHLATVLICCLLCCTALIPYVGTVLLLPLHVFWRSYSLCFLEQFGAQYRMFALDAEQHINLRNV